MTIEATHSRTGSQKPSHTVWVPVAPGLWAGSTQGDFIGLIEKVSERGFLATDGRSANLGQFTTLPEAKRAVERFPR